MEEQNQELEQNYVEIFDEDGNVIKCEIYDMIDFEGKTYALLTPMSDEETDEEVLVMEFVEEGEEGYLRSVLDDDEFNRVYNYIQTMDDNSYEEE